MVVALTTNARRAAVKPTMERIQAVHVKRVVRSWPNEGASADQPAMARASRLTIDVL